MRIERLTEDDWTRLRDIRLTGLRTDPWAFGSSLAREEGFKEAHWRMRLRSGAWFLAVDDEVAAGLVSAIVEPGAAEDDRHVMALWVDPAHRRRGLAAALLDAVAQWAVEEGARTVSLWAVEGNDAARAAYRGSGFEATGVSMPLARDPGVVEHRWVRSLDQQPPASLRRP